MDVSTVLNKHIPEISASLGVSHEPVHFKIFDGGVYEESYIDLRRKVYSDETKWLSADKLFDANDHVGRHILVYDSNTNNLMASIVTSPADQGDYFEHAQLPADEFRDAIFSTRVQVAPEYRNRGLLKLVIYLSMREGRLMGRKRYVGFSDAENIPTRRVLQYDNLEGGASRQLQGASGHTYEIFPIESSLDEGCMRSFNLLPPELQNWVRSNCFIDEIAQTVMRGAKKFYELEYFEQIRNHTLAKNHYMNSLKHQYQYVKWTTRILGRAVGMTEDADLRLHFVDHLRGEVNHEKWIENDMQYLGGDVEYMKKYLVPDAGVLNFMLIQEALTSSRLDPVMFMGVPVAIEALSGFLDEEFVTNLKATIRSWGYQNPSKGCSFLASHVHTDGAEDGHWINTLRCLGKHIQSEYQLQQVLRTIELTFKSLEDAYGSFTGTRTSVRYGQEF